MLLKSLNLPQILKICPITTLCVRGLIMGIWNSHTSIGNVLGNTIAGAFVEVIFKSL